MQARVDAVSVVSGDFEAPCRAGQGSVQETESEAEEVEDEVEVEVEEGGGVESHGGKGSADQTGVESTWIDGYFG
jgi:hypothetical protein